jgi:hypothetical protein
VGLLLHAVGKRHIGKRHISGRGVADIENEIGHQPYDVFEVDRVAAACKPADFRELGVSRRQEGPRVRTWRPGPAQHVVGGVLFDSTRGGGSGG